MSEMLLGWPNGTLGMLFGLIAGLLIVGQAWRDKPWDVHDERSYDEPARWTPAVAAPSVALIGVLLTLVLGLGALDKGIQPTFAIAGDVLGLILLPLTLWHIWHLSQRTRRPS
jgi:hypothetical protein